MPRVYPGNVADAFPCIAWGKNFVLLFWSHCRKIVDVKLAMLAVALLLIAFHFVPACRAGLLNRGNES
jgi:hypothetical protein